MNIQDAKINFDEFIGKDRLRVMFEKQSELRCKYKIPILDLDLPDHQQIAREMAWNVTEELGEVLDVYNHSKHKDHLLDELADSISFYLELLEISGVTFEDLEPNELGNDDFLTRWFIVARRLTTPMVIPPLPHSLFLENLALAINHLKNRRWRKTHLKTNVFLYRKALLETVPTFFCFICSVGIAEDEVFKAYIQKHKVNLFRLNSKY